MSEVPAWLAWSGAALLLLAVGVLLDAPWVRERVLTVDRRRLAGALVRARLRGTPEPLYPFLRDIEEGGAALVVGGAVSGIVLLIFGMPETVPRRLLLGAPLFFGLGLVTVALARLLYLAPRAAFLLVLRLAVLATGSALRLVVGEKRSAPDRIPFTYGALLAVWTGAVSWVLVGAARWWGGTGT